MFHCNFLYSGAYLTNITLVFIPFVTSCSRLCKEQLALNILITHRWFVYPSTSVHITFLRFQLYQSAFVIVVKLISHCHCVSFLAQVGLVIHFLLFIFYSFQISKTFLTLEMNKVWNSHVFDQLNLSFYEFPSDPRETEFLPPVFALTIS